MCSAGAASSYLTPHDDEPVLAKGDACASIRTPRQAAGGCETRTATSTDPYRQGPMGRRTINGTPSRWRPETPWRGTGMRRAAASRYHPGSCARARLAGRWNLAGARPLDRSPRRRRPSWRSVVPDLARHRSTICASFSGTVGAIDAMDNALIQMHRYHFARRRRRTAIGGERENPTHQAVESLAASSGWPVICSGLA